MRVGIRADGGPELGYGHLVRTGALAAELLSRRHSVVYLTSTPEPVREFLPSDIELVELTSPDNGNECALKLQSQSVDAVVTDSYHVDHQYQQALSKKIETVAVFQASDEYTLCCDILINSHLFSLDLEYEYVGAEPIWCFGLDYLLLRDEFNRLAQKEPQWREEPKKALIIMGGSDVNNTTPDVLMAFDDFAISVDAIVGPGYSNHDEIVQTAKDVDCEVNVLDTPNDLSQRMFLADFAVTALGTTVYELLMTQTPIIGIQQADNQIIVKETIEQRELGLMAGIRKPLVRPIEKMVNNQRLRKQLFERYRTLVDGKGAGRVADVIENHNL